MKNAILLIGPVRSGKSTVGRLLAESLRQPQYSMDTLRWNYYAEVGYDEAEEDRIMAASGWPGVLAYWKTFDAYAVERLLMEHGSGVIDFGAGQTVFTNEADFARVQAAFQPYPNVFLLLPSPDLDECVRISKERQGNLTWYENDFDEHFVKHPSNATLAKHTLYTQGQSPEETRDEILQLRSEHWMKPLFFR